MDGVGVKVRVEGLLQALSACRLSTSRGGGWVVGVAVEGGGGV